MLLNAASLLQIGTVSEKVARDAGVPEEAFATLSYP
jgi:hypothetical protein